MNTIFTNRFRSCHPEVPRRICVQSRPDPSGYLRMTSRKILPVIVCVVFGMAIVGCGTPQAKEDKGFFTSGSRDADQRAEQRIAQDQQNKGQSVGGKSNKGP